MGKQRKRAALLRDYVSITVSELRKLLMDYRGEQLVLFYRLEIDKGTSVKMETSSKWGGVEAEL